MLLHTVCLFKCSHPKHAWLDHGNDLECCPNQTAAQDQMWTYQAPAEITQAVNVASQAVEGSAASHPPVQPPAPKERALTPAGMDKHAKKALWDQRKAERARARQVSTPPCSLAPGS